MNILARAIGICGFLFASVLMLRGVGSRLFRLFPLFYSYIIYILCGFLGMYLIGWLAPMMYPSAYWIYYLISILVEFAVLAEISDQIFHPFPAIRSLGRALTVVISAGLGLLYVLPAILRPPDSSPVLLSIALRTFVTKAIILVVLFYVARHYGSPLGRNVGGLMLGFSIYVSINIVIMAGAQAFGEALFAPVLWVMSPLASALCLSVWTISLWDLAPVPNLRAIAKAAGRDSEAVALELTRFNNELSKFLQK